MRQIGHAKIIPDKNRHRCISELLYAKLREIPVEVALMSAEMLYKASKQDWFERQDEVHPAKRSAWDDTPDFLAKVQTDYLRHEASNYDELRAFFVPKNISARNMSTLRGLIKAEVHAKIASMYPMLASECARQSAEGKKQSMRNAA